MPKHTIKYPSADVIPEPLKQFANDKHEVTVWYGEELTVAGETNPALEKHKNDILKDKNDYEGKYKGLLGTHAHVTTQLTELQTQVASGVTVTPQEAQTIAELKKIGDIPTLLPKLQKADENENKLKQIEIDTRNNQIFQSLGYTNETVFKHLINNPIMMENVSDIVFQKKVATDKTDTPYVVLKDANNVETRKEFSEFVKDSPNWQPYLPNLTQKQERQWLQQIVPDNLQSETQGGLRNKILTATNKTISEVPNPLVPSSASSNNVNQN